MQRLFSILFLANVATLPALASSEASFNYFSYTGRDDYYNANPLTEPGDYYNPVISGWASDPSMARTGDDYWLVTSTFGYFPGVPVYHSTDLVSWRHVGNVLSRPEQLPWLEGQSIDKGGIYAPALSFNPADSTYYMITTCVMKGDKGNRSLNFYVTAKNPAEEWSNPVLLPDVDGIDPSIFFDDNGKAYIVHKSDEHSPVKWSNYRALSIIEFDPETGTTVGRPVKFKEEGVGPEERLERNEGPHIYKIEGKYYLLAAEGGTNWVHSEVCYRADSIFGPYRRWSRNPMLTQRLLKPQRRLPVTSSGHVDMVETPDGQWWAAFLGCRPWNDGEDLLGRETFLMPVKWSADGFPYITQCLDTVAIKGHRDGLDHVQQSQQAGNFTWRDDFDATKLRPEWMSMWGDPAKWLRFSDGLLHLPYAEVDTRSGVTPACLLRRIQHHKFEAETEVSAPVAAGNSAGLLMVKNETRQYFLALQPGRIALYRLGKKGHDEVVASANIGHISGPIGLKVESRGTDLDFYFRLPDGEWKPVATDVPAEHIATQRGGFTGSTIGLYATSTLAI